MEKVLLSHSVCKETTRQPVICSRQSRERVGIHVVSNPLLTQRYGGIVCAVLRNVVEVDVQDALDLYRVVHSNSNGLAHTTIASVRHFCLTSITFYRSRGEID